MAGYQVLSFTRMLTFILIFIVLLNEVNGIKLGLFAGDNKKHSNPLIIKKINRHAPVFINIHSGIPKLARLPLLPKVPPKPPPLKLFEPKLLKVKTSLSRKLPRSLITPRIPRLPLLPLMPPLIPILPLLPILPPLPLIPLPLIPGLPILSKLTNPFKPLKVPIIGKTRLQKALSSELKPIVVPIVDKKDDVLKKLLELKRNGSLTPTEFIRFKKLLLRK